MQAPRGGPAWRQKREEEEEKEEALRGLCVHHPQPKRGCTGQRTVHAAPGVAPGSSRRPGGALSSDRLFSSHSGRRSPSRTVTPVDIYLQGFCPWRCLFAPVSPLGISPGFSDQEPSQSLPLSAPGLSSASTPAPSRCALLSEPPSLRSLTHWLLPPSRPSVGPSPLSPSLPTPSPRGREAPPETGAEAAGPDASHANPPPPTHCRGPSVSRQASPLPSPSQGPCMF